MGSTEVGVPPEPIQSKRSIAEIEDLEKPPIHSERVDKELAQYVSDVRIHISPERNAELRKMVDKRVLVVMIATYFLQAIDKGTLSFASIMGLTKDTGMETAEGKVTQHVSISHLTASVLLHADLPEVLLAHHLYLHRHPRRRISPKLHHLASPDCKISQLLHHGLGHRLGLPRRLQGFHWSCGGANPPWYL